MHRHFKVCHLMKDVIFANNLQYDVKMNLKPVFVFFFLFFGALLNVFAQVDQVLEMDNALASSSYEKKPNSDILPADYLIDDYIGMLQNKNVALVINHTATVDNRLLPDTLLSLGIKINKIFAPEHGYRGNSADGAEIKDYTDPLNKVQVISLYGSKKKPTQEDLEGIDVVVFDIQDVGCRFYTFISTMTLVMQACAESHIPFIVLDRPNPNGFYIDGPVLDSGFSSFIGLHSVPVVYGMTSGEYALMVNGENWLENGYQSDLTVIKCINYKHSSRYRLPVAPSPNLPNMNAVYLYPSLCFFEGTVVSIGRGTSHPFQQVGHPDFTDGKITFTPKSIKGVSDNPPLKGKLCRGYELSSLANEIFKNGGIHLELLIEFYRNLNMKDQFFTAYFDQLAGSNLLKQQILNGNKNESIIGSWSEGIDRFRQIRKKYLIYED